MRGLSLCLSQSHMVAFLKNGFSYCFLFFFEVLNPFLCIYLFTFSYYNVQNKENQAISSYSKKSQLQSFFGIAFFFIISSQAFPKKKKKILKRLVLLDS